MKDYLQRLRGDLISEGTPYGFTLSIWGIGALGMRTYGTPTFAGVFLFIAAPVVVYTILSLILEAVLRDVASPPIHAQQSPALAYIDLFSVLPAVACAYGIYNILANPLAGLPAGSAAAMLVYNLLLALQRFVAAKATGDGSGGPE